jgi:DNA polymerase III epsilon subunit-like protein
MSTKICFIYTDTNGLHTLNEDVSTKNLYSFARLIALHYSIGTYELGKYNEIKRVDSIIKPDTISFDKVAQSFHNITMEEANEKGIVNTQAIAQLKEDLKEVDVIVSHSLPFYLKAIQVECFRTAITIDFSKFTLIDTMSYGHSYPYPKLNDIIKKLKIKNVSGQLEQIIQVFIKLYETNQVK